MMKNLLTAGALAVVLWATSPAVVAQQAHGGPSINRLPPPRPERPLPHPMDRWMAMSAQDREAALARVNPERREKLIQQIERWQRMSPRERERARWFFNLPPDQKQIVTAFNKWMQTLPEERRPIIRREINSLQELSPEARQAELDAPSFTRKFDAEEREHIGKMISVMPAE
jgi:hypothetical protein